MSRSARIRHRRKLIRENKKPLCMNFVKRTQAELTAAKDLRESLRRTGKIHRHDRLPTRRDDVASPIAFPTASELEAINLWSSAMVNAILCLLPRECTYLLIRKSQNNGSAKQIHAGSRRATKIGTFRELAHALAARSAGDDFDAIT